LKLTKEDIFNQLNVSAVTLNNGI